MADALFLSLWFPSFTDADMMPRALSVLRQFPFAAQRPGIAHFAVHPLSWSEPTVLERRFRPGLDPEQAAAILAEFANSDYAFVFEVYWDLWVPRDEADDSALMVAPSPVKIVVHGTEFEEQLHQQAGHIQVDFGLDSPFLYEGRELTPEIESRFRSNVQKMVAFTMAVEKNCGISGRVLWSESDESFAQKLIQRLQKVQ